MFLFVISISFQNDSAILLKELLETEIYFYAFYKCDAAQTALF